MKKILLLLFCALFLAPTTARSDTWAIYIYICGSDLEQQHSLASNDIVEIANAEYSNSVTVVAQTGGTKKWEELSTDNGPYRISTRNLERYVFSSDACLEKIGSLPQKNMGDPKTLAEFISFCVKNYPADHKILVIWNHGGGSVGELARDQNFNMKGLTLDDLHNALARVFTERPETPPFDIIGFDACLMSTLDVGLAVEGFARYMIASQEVIPGFGWSYTPFISAISKNDSIDPKDLGKVIIDAYFEALHNEIQDDFDPEALSTLSLLDLSRIKKLKETWDMLGFEIVTLLDNEDFETVLARIGRAAERSDNFTNSKSDGYSNMMDMGSFLQNARSFLPEMTDLVLKRINDTVIYKTNGTQHRDACGISCYYPYDGGEGLAMMLNAPYSSPITVLQALGSGDLNSDDALARLRTLYAKVENAEIPEDGKEIENQGNREKQGNQENQGTVGNLAGILVQSVSEASKQEQLFPNLPDIIASIKPTQSFSVATLKDAPLNIGDDGQVNLEIGADAAKHLKNVFFLLAYYDEKDDVIVALGNDADMYSDWEKGIFTSHFRNKWAELNGHIVYLDITGVDKNNFYYSIPLKINGKECNLRALYSISEQKYKIIGVNYSSESKIIDKFLAQIKDGDKVTTRFPATKISDDSDFEEIELETFTIVNNPGLEDADLGDAKYVYMFQMVDSRGNSETSEVAMISVQDGKISFSK